MSLYTGDSAGRFVTHAVSRSALTWIFIAQGLTIVPLFFFLPTWLLAVWLMTVFTRIQIHRGVWPYPGNLVKLSLGVAGAVGLYLSFGRIGVEPMIGFLVLSFVLKVVEVRKRSDVLIVIYIGFIAIAAQLLLSQTFWMSFYSLCCCVVLLAAMQSVFQHRRVSALHQLRESGVLLLKSLPVMLVLFLLMPRLGQLWAVPTMQGVGKSGFSDSMAPGDLSELIKSDEIVFRATFDGVLPPREQRYWRGLVLEKFDGRRWERFGAQWSPITLGAQPADSPLEDWQLQLRNSDNTLKPVGELDEQDPSYRYTILLEPHNYEWLFTLMAPVEAYSDNLRPRFHPQILLLNQTPVTTRSAYEVLSVPNYRIGPKNLSDSELNRARMLPDSGNQQARALANQWRRERLSEQEKIAAALALFAEDFTYTLQPPPLGKDAVDDFLFTTRRGFCEHFASSFVFLMRAAGVPARVVVGYQGGQVNQRGYVTVRQSDAHAWAEVWDIHNGWVRVDPTSVVSPLRIERALYEAVDRQEASLVGGALLRMSALAWAAAVRSQFEEWDYLWQTRVLNYNDEQQAGFFQKYLGGQDPWRLALFFVATVGALLIIYYLVSILQHPGKQQSAEFRLLQQALRKLEKQGFTRKPEETPKAFAERVVAAGCAGSETFKEIVELHYAIAYRGDRNKLESLKKLVNQS